MKVSIIKGEELSSDLKRAWKNIQLADKNFYSPYLSPEYTFAVSMVRPDIYVAILEENNTIVGYFPFQKEDNGCGKPVGKGICDYQGVVIKDRIEWEAKVLIKKCGMQCWEFDHLIMGQSQFEKYYHVTTDSPIIELFKGFETYVSKKKSQGSRVISQIKRKIRKFEKEIGTIRFEFAVDSGETLNQLMAWKSAQHNRTKVFDLFGVDWIIRLVKRIHHTKTELFRGNLSAIFLDNLPLAIHMGMIYKNVLHSWFPAYNIEYAKFSPGLILILKILEHAYNEGIDIVDLGKVTYFYKKRLMTGAIPIAEGVVI
jgi:CelD/BcsL family acetyltransferase involved in cellulose biosynthesis